MAISVPEKLIARNRIFDPIPVGDAYASWISNSGSRSDGYDVDYRWKQLTVDSGAGNFLGQMVEYVVADEQIYISMKVKVSEPVDNVTLTLMGGTLAGYGILMGNKTFSLQANVWTELRDRVRIPAGTSTGTSYLTVMVDSEMTWGENIQVRELVAVGGVETPYFFGGTPPFLFQDQLVTPYFDFSGEGAYSQFDYYDVQGEPPSVDWSSNASRRFTIGADRGMLYRNNYGYAWPGLISVDRAPSDEVAEKRYLDGQLIDVSIPTPDYSATLEVYTYPEEFEPCIGIVTLGSPSFRAYGQESERFSFCYRTFIGDGNDPQSHYRLHFVYDALAEDQGHVSSTMSESSEADSFKFKIHAIPKNTPGLKATSYFTVDSRSAVGLIVGLERVLYGHLGSTPRLPTIDEIKTYLQT